MSLRYIEQSKSDQSLASTAAIISKMAKGEEGVYNYTFQGVNKIGAYAPIKTTGWSIAVTVPTDQVLEKAADLKWTLLVISVIIILIALVLTFVMAGNISNPVKAAVEHARLMAGGDFTLEVPERLLCRRDGRGQRFYRRSGWKGWPELPRPRRKWQRSRVH